MNLQTFAVKTHLATGSNLIDYVQSQTDVPLSIVEDVFGPLIDTLTDDKSQQLIDNYQDYLIEHTRIGLVTSGIGSYDVSGEIDDRVLHVIEAIHKVTPTTVVEDLIKATFEPLQGDRQLTIEEITFSESVDHLLELQQKVALEPSLLNKSSDNDITVEDLQSDVAVADTVQPTSNLEPNVQTFTYDSDEPVVVDDDASDNLDLETFDGIGDLTLDLGEPDQDLEQVERVDFTLDLTDVTDNIEYADANEMNLLAADGTAIDIDTVDAHELTLLDGVNEPVSEGETVDPLAHLRQVVENLKAHIEQRGLKDKFAEFGVTLHIA